MRRGGRILIMLGIVLGIATFVGAFFLLTTGGGTGSGNEPAVATTKVLVAIQKIPAHSIIPPTGAYELRDWPNTAIPPNAKFIQQIMTKTVLAAVNIESGQPIGENMIIDKQAAELFKGFGSDASALIPKGKVLVSFPINQQASIAGAIRSGDRVDIMATYAIAPTAGSTTQASGIKQITQYTLQDVEIVWIGLWPAKAGEQAAEDSRNAAFVTFIVDRQDALVLKFLRETSAETQFALRAAGDRDKANVEPIVIEYIDQRFNFQNSLGRSR